MKEIISIEAMEDWIKNPVTDCCNCKHEDKLWDEEPCDSCCGYKGFELKDEISQKIQCLK